MSRPQPSTHCLFVPAELGGVLPRTLWDCPHRRLAPAVLRALCRQLQAGRGVGVLGQLWKLSQPLPIPWSRSPSLGWEALLPLFRALVEWGRWGAGASGKGDGAASPALTHGLSLHLHRIQLPRIILEQSCGLGTGRDFSPPGSHLPPGGPCWTRQGSSRSHPTCPFRPLLGWESGGSETTTCVRSQRKSAARWG